MNDCFLLMAVFQNAGDDTLLDFLEHGATAVLAKPLMFEELADILRQNNL